MMKRMGCLMPLVVLIVIAFGYNQWRIEQLRDEVSRISAKVHVTGGNTKSGEGKNDLVTALAKAERHTKRARELLAKKHMAEAQRELDAALKSLQSANDVSQDIVGDAAQFLGKARQSAVKVFHKAWTDISEEAKPKKKGS